MAETAIAEHGLIGDLVENEDHRIPLCRQAHGQPDQRGPVDAVRIVGQADRRYVNACAGQPGDQIGPEHSWLAVFWFQADPDHRALTSPPTSWPVPSCPNPPGR